MRLQYPTGLWVNQWPSTYPICDLTAQLNILLEVGLTAGAAARGTEQRKHVVNDGKCRELSWVCVPTVIEAYGAWGAESLESLSRLASRLATSSNTEGAQRQLPQQAKWQAKSKSSSNKCNCFTY